MPRAPAGFVVVALLLTGCANLPFGARNPEAAAGPAVEVEGWDAIGRSPLLPPDVLTVADVQHPVITGRCHTRHEVITARPNGSSSPLQRRSSQVAPWLVQPAPYLMVSSMVMNASPD